MVWIIAGVTTAVLLYSVTQTIYSVGYCRGYNAGYDKVYSWIRRGSD